MEQYKKIPGHSKYEATGLGKTETLMIRSIASGIYQMQRKDTGKFQLVNDEGTRPQLTSDEIKALFPKDRVLTSFGKTEPSKAKQLDLLPTEELDSREDVKRIMNEINFKKHDKIYRLGLLKLSVEQIAEITKSSIGSVQTTLSEYATGKRKGIAGDKKLAYNPDNIVKTPLCNKSFSTSSPRNSEVADIKELKERVDIIKILNEASYKKHQKIYNLHTIGLDKKQISALTGSSVSNISGTILFYKQGKHKEFKCIV